MVVTAVAAASITKGGRRLAGHLRISETPEARLVAGDLIRFRVEGARLSSLPSVSTNARSGLAAALMEQDDQGFVLRVSAASRPREAGVIAVSELVYDVPSEASEGLLAVVVRGSNWSGTVSNAKVTD